MMSAAAVVVTALLGPRPLLNSDSVKEVVGDFGWHGFVNDSYHMDTSRKINVNSLSFHVLLF